MSYWVHIIICVFLVQTIASVAFPYVEGTSSHKDRIAREHCEEPLKDGETCVRAYLTPDEAWRLHRSELEPVGDRLHDRDIMIKRKKETTARG